MSFIELTLVFFLLLISASALHLISEYRKHTAAIYLFKSLGTITIICYAALLGDFTSSYQQMIVIGLIFSLFGDIFLIRQQHFTFGLLSFLIAHLFYIASFVSNMEFVQIVYLPSLIPFLVFAVSVGLLIYKNLGKLLIPVGLYILIIVVMGWQALNQHLALQSVFAISAFIGASLFMLSDSFIAINRFRMQLKHERVLIMSTYYVGQFLIAGSIEGIQ